MKSLRDRGRRLRAKAGSTSVVFVRKKSAACCANRLGGVLLLAVLFAVGGSVVRAQNARRPGESPLMRELQQALSLYEQGDRQGAMNSVLRLLDRHPDFEPAVKLKGMLLEEAGQTSEAATACEEALKLAPNDADVLLKT